MGIGKEVPLFSLVRSMADLIDMVSPHLADHHKRVAYIAVNVAKSIDLPKQNQRDILLAGLLHDIGALSERERIEALDFETRDGNAHAEVGYLLLNKFEPLLGAARIIRHHHARWDSDFCGNEGISKEIPLGGLLLHLADRVEVLINRDTYILHQVEGICQRIIAESGSMFSPLMVSAFLELAQKESFWLGLTVSLDSLLEEEASLQNYKLDLEGLNSLGLIFSHLVDFRSPFTATHSMGVSATATSLAKMAGFSETDCQLMRVAGLMHDLGKLAVPAHIIDKPGKLTAEEYAVIKCHAFYTNLIFQGMKPLERLRRWAAYHHERLDGGGYPFHYEDEEISAGSRIMAVADVFTALTEDRPYRSGMAKPQVLSVLYSMVEEKALDSTVVSLLVDNFEAIEQVRIRAQQGASEEYRFLKG